MAASDRRRIAEALFVEWGKRKPNMDAHEAAVRAYALADAFLDVGQGASSCPVDDLIEIYRECCPTMQQFDTFPRSGRAELAKAWREERVGLPWWREFFKLCNSMPWLRGENDDGWRADFLWLIRKRGDIQSGRYSNVKKNSRNSSALERAAERSKRE